MNIVYQSNKYTTERIEIIHGRKLQNGLLRVFEVAENRHTIREYDIDAPSITYDAMFNDGYQHILSENQLNILNRLVKIDEVLDTL